MNYLDKVLNYFKFSSNIIISGAGIQKKTINISGKPTKRTIMFYILFVLFFLGWSIIAYFLVTLNNNYISINLRSDLKKFIFIATIAIILVFIKSKYIFKKNESIPKNINIYQRELPSKLKPAHVRMLLNDGLIDETSIASTLLDLIDKGYLKLSRTGNKINIFNNGDIILTKTNKNQNNLLEYEQFLIKWFIDDCGNGYKVTSNELKRALALNKNNNYPPSYLFEYFQALVIISFPIHKYYIKRSKLKNKLNSLVLTLGYILIIFWFFTICTGHEINVFVVILGLFLLIYGSGTMFFASPTYILSQEGVEEEDNWLDLKKYLKEFSDIENKTPEMISLWDYYLTYSVALGIDSITSNEIESFFGQEIYNSNNQIEDHQSTTNNPDVNKVIEQNIEQEKIKYQQIIGLK